MAVEEVVTSWVSDANTAFDSSGTITLRGQLGGHIKSSDFMNDTPMRVVKSGEFLNSLLTHPDHQAATLSNIRVWKDDSPLVLRWQADFETRTPPGIDSAGQGPDIIPRSWTFELATVSTVESVTQNYQGLKFIPVTGDPYDPPLQAEFNHLVAIFTTEQIPINPGLIAEFRNTVNDRTFLNMPTGHCRMGAIRARAQFTPGKPPVMSCTAEVNIKHPDLIPPDGDPWAIRAIAHGYHILDQNTQKPVRAKKLNADGSLGSEDSDTPVLHRSSVVGGAIGSRIDNPLDAQFYNWQVYKYANFDRFFRDMLG